MFESRNDGSDINAVAEIKPSTQSLLPTNFTAHFKLDEVSEQFFQLAAQKSISQFLTILGFGAKIRVLFTEDVKEADESASVTDSVKDEEVEQKQSPKQLPVGSTIAVYEKIKRPQPRDPSATVPDFNGERLQVTSHIISGDLAALQRMPNYNYNYLDDFCVTPLMWAKMFGQKEIVDYLQSQGAKIVPPLAPEELTRYVEASVKLISDSNDDGLPLHGLLQTLVESVENIDQIVIDDDPIFVRVVTLGIYFNCAVVDIVRAFLDKGCAVDQYYHEDDEVVPYVIFALTEEDAKIGANSHEIIKLLIDRGLNIREMHKGFPTYFYFFDKGLLAHVFNKYPELATPEALNRTFKQGVSLLRWVADLKVVDCISYLLELGADPAIKDNEGNTALHVLGAEHWTYLRLYRLSKEPKIYQEYKEVIQQLITSGSYSRYLQNDKGETPVHVAAKSHWPAVLELLVADEKGGADVNARDNDGNTALHLVFKTIDQGKGTEEFLNDTVSTLLRFENIDVNAINSSGDTALHIALRCLRPHSKYISEKMLQKLTIVVVSICRFSKANLGIIDQEGSTAIMRLLQIINPRYQDEILHRILDKIDINEWVRGGSFSDIPHVSLLHHTVYYRLAESLCGLIQNRKISLNVKCTVSHNENVSVFLMLCSSDWRQDHKSKLVADIEFSIIEYLLERTDVIVNSVTKERSPLLAAFKNEDIRLFNVLMAHPRVDLNVEFNNSDTLTEMLEYIDRWFDNEVGLQVPKSMCLSLLTQSRLLPLPALPVGHPKYGADFSERAWTQLHRGIEAGDLDILRAIILHPHAAVKCLLNKEVATKVFDYIRYHSAADNDSEKRESMKRLFESRILLLQVEVNIKEGNKNKAMSLLKQATDLDMATVEAFAKQLLRRERLDWSEEDRATFCNHPAILATDDVGLLILLGQQFESRRDLLLARGFYQKAETLLPAEEKESSELKFVIENKRRCQRSLAESEVFTNFAVDDLTRPLANYVKNNSGIFCKAADLPTAMSLLSYLREEKDCKKIYERLLRDRTQSFIQKGSQNNVLFNIIGWILLSVIDSNSPAQVQVPSVVSLRV